MEKRRRTGSLPSQRKPRRNDNSGGSIYLLPFRLVWRLLVFILATFGRLASIIIGLVLIVVGVLITVLTGGIGGVCGGPIAVFGGLLVLRSIF